MHEIVFDARYLYYISQYLPVLRALERRGARCRFTFYRDPATKESIERAIARYGLQAGFVADKAEAVEQYIVERPDWIVFGTNFPEVHRLPPSTRTAQLYHGIGMKSDVYDPELVRMSVRFVEGAHYARNIRKRFPDAVLAEVGYAKLDPLFWPEPERPRLELGALGLDPRRKTVLYAPTYYPSSLGRMADDWPAHFSDLNLIVKAHPFSYDGRRYGSHRRKMARWARAKNVHVVPAGEFDALPYIAAADLLVSDVSALAFEFAATDKPVVLCDFLALRWNYRGPFRYRLRRRMDESIHAFDDIGAHAPRYRDLRPIVAAELEQPERFGARRRHYAPELVGPTDGRAAERIADYLLQPPRAEAGEPAQALHARVRATQP